MRHTKHGIFWNGNKIPEIPQCIIFSIHMYLPLPVTIYNEAFTYKPKLQCLLTLKFSYFMFTVLRKSSEQDKAEDRVHNLSLGDKQRVRV